MTQQVHILDDQQTASSGDQSEPTTIEVPETPSPHADAEPIEGSFQRAFGSPAELSAFERWRRGRFVRAVAARLDKREALQDMRLLDELDAEQTDDVDLGVLFAFPDESVLFVGSDPTAADAIPLFAFAVESSQPLPLPTTARDALDLLKPADVRDAFAADAPPDRQGEWWLLPTDKVPVGTVFRPGVSDRPYGPSPLGNHVPREYGFAVPDDEFMAGVRERVPELPESVTTPPEVIQWIYRQRRKVPTPDFAPEWGAIREVADEIFVRGTLRHRDRDHFVEDLEEQWHEAQTHDVDVFTGDDVIDRVVVD